MNSYLEIQIRNMILASKNFYQASLVATRKDDGRIDSNEEKALKEIDKAVTHFVSRLEKLIK